MKKQNSPMMSALVISTLLAANHNSGGLLIGNSVAIAPPEPKNKYNLNDDERQILSTLSPKQKKLFLKGKLEHEQDQKKKAIEKSKSEKVGKWEITKTPAEDVLDKKVIEDLKAEISDEIEETFKNQVLGNWPKESK